MLTIQSVSDHKREHKSRQYRLYVIISVKTNAGNTDTVIISVVKNDSNTVNT